MLMNASGCSLITAQGWDFKFLFLLRALNWLVLLWCSAFGCWCEQRCFLVLLNDFVLVIIFSPFLEIFSWIPVQLFLAVWRVAVYLSVGTGAAEGVADPLLGIPSPLGQDFVPSLWWGTPAAAVSVSSPGLYSCEQDIFLLGMWTLTACLSHLCDALTFWSTLNSTWGPICWIWPQNRAFLPFSCQSSLLLTAAEQPSSGPILHSHTAGTLAVGWKY